MCSPHDIAVKCALGVKQQPHTSLLPGVMGVNCEAVGFDHAAKCSSDDFSVSTYEKIS